MKRLNRISLIMPYFNSAGMLTSQLMGWEMGYSRELLDTMTFIIIDDGSPETPAIDVVKMHYPDLKVPFRLRLYRVIPNIPWNQHGCRNLGAKMAADDWLFMTDIDHSVPYETMMELARMKLSHRLFYTFKRMTAVKREEDGEVVFEPMLNNFGQPKPHPNTFLLHKESYWSTGGYDEDYCGTYGGDGPFRKWLERTTKHHHFDNLSIIRWPREVISDASQPREYREAFRGKYKPVFNSKGGGQADKPSNPIRFLWKRLI